MNQTNIRQIVFFAVCLTMLPSCAVIKVNDKNYFIPQNACISEKHQPTPRQSKKNWEEAIQKLNARTLKAFNERSVITAHELGIIDLIDEMIGNQNDTSLRYSGETRQIYRRQQITSVLLKSLTEVASVSSVLSCERERADQAINYLTKRENRRARKLTALSIIAGSATGIGASLFTENTQDHEAVWVSIIGGAWSVGLGVAALALKEEVLFEHKENILTDIWFEKSQSERFPPFVWSILNEKKFSSSKEFTILHYIRERWEINVVSMTNVKESKNKEVLLFGAGGLYTIEDLQQRVIMLNQAQAAVNLVNQELLGLMKSLPD